MTQPLKVNRELVRQMFLEGKANHVIAKTFGVTPDYVRSLKFQMKLTVPRVPSKPITIPPPAFPLSPAMRHLAQFDPIIAARKKREEESTSSPSSTDGPGQTAGSTLSPRQGGMPRGTYVGSDWD